ncbi:MAG: TIGR01777 family oxidoreductase [Bacteroidales bacterium]|nr:TIGR01777 family oxidoreductase [Bacteroidales bacterium]MBN2633711.1 TIGR01777 family oxidoreductase [Bacteroidales bacterium]
MPAEKSNKGKVLITGGSGLVGMHLTSLLLEEGYTVVHLSRKQDQFGKVRVYRWNPEKGILDPAIFFGVDHIVHLAGAGIGEGRWTRKRKEDILKSREDSARLIHSVVTAGNFPVKSFISASGAGYYGMRTDEKIYTEEDPPGSGFLASVCHRWEVAADLFDHSGIRTVKIRTTLVLDAENPAMKKLLLSSCTGILSGVGSGKQYMPWIHISDLCRIYLKAITDTSLAGAVNASAPGHVTHNEFMRALASVRGKCLSPVNVPAFLLSAFLGEMAEVILKGSRISSRKIINAGFDFRYSQIEEALRDVMSGGQIS